MLHAIARQDVALSPSLMRPRREREVRERNGRGFAPPRVGTVNRCQENRVPTVTLILAPTLCRLSIMGMTKPLAASTSRGIPVLSRSPASVSGTAVMCDINTTPLIDVMLVLLVTLIVTLPVM